MHQHAHLILWIYIILLFLGGLMGFLKAGSKASLIMSSVFAAILILCNMTQPRILDPGFASILTDIVLVFLLIFFAMRLSKSKKFMPNGLMSVLTLAALLLLNFRF